MFGRSNAAAGAVATDESGGRTAALTILPGMPLPAGVAPAPTALADLSAPLDHDLEPVLVGAFAPQDDTRSGADSGAPSAKRSFGLRRKAKSEPFDDDAFAAPAPEPVSPFTSHFAAPESEAVGEAHIVTEVHVEPVTDEFVADAAQTAEFADLMDDASHLPPPYVPEAVDAPMPPPYVPEAIDAPMPPPYVPEAIDAPMPPPYVPEAVDGPMPPPYVPQSAAPESHLPEVREPSAAPMPPAPIAPAPVSQAPIAEAPVEPARRESFFARLLTVRPSSVPVAPHEEDPFAEAWSGRTPVAQVPTAPAPPAFVPEPPAPSSFEPQPPPPPYIPAEVPTEVPTEVQAEVVEVAVAQPVAPPAPADPAAPQPLPQFGQLVPPQVAEQAAFPAPTVGLVFADGSHAELPDGPAGAALQHVANVLGDHENRRQAGSEEPGAAPIE